MNGFINLNKSAGLSSNQALTKLKRLINAKKAGFLGTLDPCATGILPIGIGFATKLFPYFEKTNKTYCGEIIFGSETDTQDSTGVVTDTKPVGNLGSEQLEQILLKFTGNIEQLPPMFSAKKVDGKRLYKSARKGVEVEREPKKVTIHSLHLDDFTGERATITAVVSTGTYIRTLFQDIGRSAGTLAHMGELTRTRSHVFEIESSITIDEINNSKDNPSRWLLPLDYPLEFMKKHTLTSTQEIILRNGSPLNYDCKKNEELRLYNEADEFIGLGRTDRVVRKLFKIKLTKE